MAIDSLVTEQRLGTIVNETYVGITTVEIGSKSNAPDPMLNTDLIQMVMGSGRVAQRRVEEDEEYLTWG